MLLQVVVPDVSETCVNILKFPAHLYELLC